GIARNVLADRLNRLVDGGILERRRYSERPPRDEYVLTDKGRELRLALTGLRQWGDRYLSEQPPRLLQRKRDGAPVAAALVPVGVKPVWLQCLARVVIVPSRFTRLPATRAVEAAWCRFAFAPLRE